MSARVVESPIDVAALMARVADASCGATAVFVGTVRDVNDGRAVSGIDYTAYTEMAVREMERIVAEAVDGFGAPRIAIEHRVGYLELGEASVAIAVAHPHRGPALDAVRYVIEELKKRVPVWKREHYVDGTREWVDPTRAPAEAQP